MNLFAGEPNGKKFRAAVDRRFKEDDASFGSLLLGAAEESLLPETLDAPPGVVYDLHSKSYAPGPHYAAAAEGSSSPLAEAAAA